MIVRGIRVNFATEKEMTMETDEIVRAMRTERDQLLAKAYHQRLTGYDVPTLLAAGEIKLITGPRRAGKSTMAILMLRNRNFAYLNFDNRKLLDSWDEDAVEASLDVVFPGYEFLLLDEVQNLPQWELWVAQLYRRGRNMVITGSNARMLGSEMATALTGRFLPVEVMPLSLEEALMWQESDEITVLQREALTDDYLRLGGFPETIKVREITETYLATLFDAIVLKDMAMRHRVRRTAELSRLAAYLVSNIDRPMTLRSIMEAVGFSSVSTTQKFIEYMTEPYLFFFLPRYDNKLRLMNRAPRKVYIADNGFVAAKAFSISPDNGRLLENAVFVELVRRGYKPGFTLFYYRSRNGKEVDFVTRRGVEVERVIQVCYDMSQARTRRREIDSLTECASELGGGELAIVTRSESGSVEYGGKTINIMTIGELAKWCSDENRK